MTDASNGAADCPVIDPADGAGVATYCGDSNGLLGAPDPDPTCEVPESPPLAAFRR